MKNRNVLVTAGNTSAPIDKVRSITNIFRGRTGTRIAQYFCQQGCKVTLLCSHPELVDIFPRDAIKIVRYTTYDDLETNMRNLITTGRFGTVIHSSAVSDYKPAGMYVRVGETAGNEKRQAMIVEELDRSGKIGSDHPELWMRLTATAKLIDKIRMEWGFTGTLVKFKLQVGMDDEELTAIAVRSMRQSQANFIVANTLEGMTDKAFIIGNDPKNVTHSPIPRDDLPAALYNAVMR
jgi:phosphopantothenoylcysteine synthetase/decarboxylase